MARSWRCRSDKHEECPGTVLAGPPNPVIVEKCKCECHKKGKND